METIFKIGDKVKVKKICTGCVPGVIYTLCCLETRRKLFAHNGIRFDSGCSCQNNWILQKEVYKWKLSLKSAIK